MDWDTNPPFGIGDENILSSEFTAHCNTQLAILQLKQEVAPQRILDIFCAWKGDLKRSKENSFRNDSVSPDHIKSAAHLTYWIRRQSPIIRIVSQSPESDQIFTAKPNGYGSMYSESEMLAMDMELGLSDTDLLSHTALSIEDQQATMLYNGMTMAEFKDNRERVFAYGNELFAFTFGFLLAKSYEEQKLLENNNPKIVAMPDGKYIEDLCYFFKFKSVSPHSIDLIFRALLKNYVN